MPKIKTDSKQLLEAIDRALLKRQINLGKSKMKIKNRNYKVMINKKTPSTYKIKHKITCKFHNLIQ